MKRAIAFLVVATIAALQFTSCKETVTETKYVHDTTAVHDTMPAPAYIRFVSMISGSNIIAIRREDNPSGPIMYARDQCQNLYYAVSSNATVVYRLTVEGQDLPMPLPAFKPGSANTMALFFPGSSLDPRHAIDSEKLQPAPKGFCYVRLINAIGDHTPSPAWWFDMGTDSVFE